MKITESRIVELISKGLRKVLTEEEQLELEAWKAESPENRVFVERFTDEAYITSRLAQRKSIDVDAALQRFRQRAGLDSESAIPMRKRSWHLVAAAAIIGVLVAGGLLYQYTGTRKSIEDVAVADTKDIMPGSDKAVLILADNSKIELDSQLAGTLAKQDDIAVIKKSDGSIVYDVSQVGKGKASTEIAFNTLITPRGGQYKLVLPDGSKVWLNAASSIKYPAYFTGTERAVEITGEAYFEVAKNAAMPFKVHFGDAIVEVLGTHFNINTYGDEQMSNTTLLEGSIRLSNSPTASVSPALQSVVLKPGQQAVLNKANRIAVSNGVDIDQVMAWKEGYFNFDNADLRTIMKHISRWYDRDIVYETNDDHRFSFRLPRQVPVSKLLNILERTGAVKFTINDKEIRVIK